MVEEPLTLRLQDSTVPQVDSRDEKRVGALESRNAVRYFQLCNEQGISPENPELYERGQFESELEAGSDVSIPGTRQPRKKIRRSQENYLKFLGEVRAAGVPLGFGEWPNIKMELLVKYFPTRFSKGFDGRSDAEVGQMFIGLVSSAQKVERQVNRQ